MTQQGKSNGNKKHGTCTRKNTHVQYNAQRGYKGNSKKAHRHLSPLQRKMRSDKKVEAKTNPAIVAKHARARLIQQGIIHPSESGQTVIELCLILFLIGLVIGAVVLAGYVANLATMLTTIL